MVLDHSSHLDSLDSGSSKYGLRVPRGCSLARVSSDCSRCQRCRSRCGITDRARSDSYWLGYLLAAFCEAAPALKDQRLRFGSNAGVVVKFNLPPTETTHDAPAAIRGELSKFILRHRPQDSELCRMGDENFRPSRKHGRDFRSKSRQMFAHFQLMLALATGPRCRFLQPFFRQRRGRFVFSIQLGT